MCDNTKPDIEECLKTCEKYLENWYATIPGKIWALAEIPERLRKGNKKYGTAEGWNRMPPHFSDCFHQYGYLVPDLLHEQFLNGFIYPGLCPSVLDGIWEDYVRRQIKQHQTLARKVWEIYVITIHIKLIEESNNRIFEYKELDEIDKKIFNSIQRYFQKLFRITQLGLIYLLDVPKNEKESVKLDEHREILIGCLEQLDLNIFIIPTVNYFYSKVFNQYKRYLDRRITGEDGTCYKSYSLPVDDKEKIKNTINNLQEIRMDFTVPPYF